MKMIKDYFKMSNLPFLKFEFSHFKSKKCQIWAELFFKIFKTYFKVTLSLQNIEKSSLNVPGGI